MPFPGVDHFAINIIYLERVFENREGAMPICICTVSVSDILSC